MYVWVMEQCSARLKRKKVRMYFPLQMVKTILYLGHDDPMSSHLDVQRASYAAVRDPGWRSAAHET